MAQATEIPTLKPSRGPSSQEEKARGASIVRQKDYHTGRNMEHPGTIPKGQISSFETKIPNAFGGHSGDYLASTCEFAGNRHRREKIDINKMKTTNITTSSKLMGGPLANQQHFFPAGPQQQFHSLN